MLLDTVLQRKKRMVAGAIIALLLAGLSIFLVSTLTQETIYKGVRVDDLDVSGSTPDEAVTLVQNLLNEQIVGQKLVLKYGGLEWAYPLDDIGFRFLVEEAVGKAFSLGREGNLFQRLRMIAHLGIYGQYIRSSCDFDRDRLQSLLKKIKGEVDREPQNAQVSYTNGKIQKKKDVWGSFLDIDMNIKLVENNLEGRNFDDIGLDVKGVVPLIRFEDVEPIESIVASFHTRFNPGDADRSHNIRLACSRINGKVLLPMDIFSMNRVLGPRTLENGYRNAPVIYKNELIQGPGGGVCQVTTTLYNSVLQAKLSVLERTHHSMPLGYVQPGQDATIAEGSIDFKFQNRADTAVCIAADVKGDTIRIRILGKKSAEKTVVKLVPRIIAEYPPDKEEVIVDDTLPDGEVVVDRQAKPGLRVVLYRETYSADGHLIESEKISEDYYRPVKGRIKVNQNTYSNYYSIEGSIHE